MALEAYIESFELSFSKFAMDGFGITLAIGALKALAFVYDIITYPIYAIIQRPWHKLRLSKRVKALPVAITRNSETKDETKLDLNGATNIGLNETFVIRQNNNKAVPITSDVTSITYRSVMSPTALHIELIQNNIDTMEKMFKYIVKKYANRRCLGTREILNEEDELQPNGRIFKKYNMGEYRWRTFSDVERQAVNFGKGLRALGCEAHKNVAIFAETRAEWMIAAQALFKESIPMCTIYATLGDEGIVHALNETEVDTVITSFELLPKVKGILHRTPRIKTIIYMEDQLKTPTLDGYGEIKVLTFTEVLKLGENGNTVALPPKPDDIAIIMYTSGSTGTPKGVMITHANLIATVKGFCDNVQIKDDDILIGFLPLAHVFELLAEHVCLLTGIQIGYSTALTLFDTASKIKKGTKGDASVLKPTCMTSVPLILDRVSKGIQEKVSKGSTLSKVMFKFAYDYKLYWINRGSRTPLLDRFIFTRVKSLLGGKVRLVLVGGAPLSPDTHEQIKTCLCEHVIQGYGLTETTSMATVMDYYDLSYGRVGGPTSMCDIKLIDWDEGNYRVTDRPYPRGELVVGGENVTLGYFKQPEKTKEEYFEENGKRWFKTGDIGEVHEDGVVKIIDRKKDLVKLQAGEYVSLGKVEAELKTCPLVENICVYGDSSKQYTVALIVPNPKVLSEMAAKLGISDLEFEHLCNNPAVEKAVVKELADHGKKCKLEKFEIPLAVKLCTEVWSPDMGLVTAAFKLKRKDIQERYQHEINRMYAS